MQVNILIFGQLTDITGSDHLVLKDIDDTDTLIKELSHMYPNLNDIKYRVAVNKKIINGNVALKEHTTVALMPPFSGG